MIKTKREIFLERKKNMEDSFENQATQSHKGERIKSYTLRFKLEAVMYVEVHHNRSAGRKFNVDVRRIREWRKKKEQISKQSKKSCGKERKTLEGAVREFVESKVLEWI